MKQKREDILFCIKRAPSSGENNTVATLNHEVAYLSAPMSGTPINMLLTP